MDNPGSSEGNSAATKPCFAQSAAVFPPSIFLKSVWIYHFSSGFVLQVPSEILPGKVKIYFLWSFFWNEVPTHTKRKKIPASSPLSLLYIKMLQAGTRSSGPAWLLMASTIPVSPSHPFGCVSGRVLVTWIPPFPFPHCWRRKITPTRTQKGSY